jgi:hypothetical protein
MPKLQRALQNKLRRALRERRVPVPPEIARLGKALWDEEDDALGHEECITALPAFVTAEADGLRVAELYPDIKRHLDRCDNCAAQYVDLLQLALAQVGDALPQPVAVPAPDLSFLDDRPAALRDSVLKWAQQILAALAPGQLPGFQLVADVFFEEVGALGGKLSLQAMTVRGQEEGAVLAALALSYATAQSLASTITFDQLREWSNTGTLQQAVQACALSAAQEISLDPETASTFAREIAAQVANDPASLRALIW